MLANYENVSVTVKVMDVITNEGASAQEQRETNAAIFETLADIQRQDQLPALVDIFIKSDALSGENHYTVFAIGGEQFYSRPVSARENNSSARFQTTVTLLLPVKDKELLVSLFRAQTVPVYYIAVADPLTFELASKFLEETHSQQVKFQFFLRQSYSEIEVIVAGESSNYQRHALCTLHINQQDPDKLTLVFNPELDAVYVIDPLVKLVADHMCNSPTTLEWLCRINTNESPATPAS